eukprot:4079097-Ditylum_brightwellii.AAC.1
MKYEQLDRTITEGILSAEKTCCRSKTGYAGSLKLVKAGKLVRYWKMRKSSLKNNKTCSHLQNLATSLGMEEDGTLGLADIDKRLTKARKDLKL